MSFEPHDSLHQQLDQLIDAAAGDLANAAEPHDFAQRLKNRSLTMNLTPATPNGNVLLFTTVDRSRGGRDNRTFAGAVLLHAAAAALLLVGFGLHATQRATIEPAVAISLVAPPPPLPPRAVLAGGGGGQQGPAPVTKGNPPKFSAEQLNPPKVPPLVEPKVEIQSTVDVQKDLKMAKVDVPQFGMPNAPAVGMSMGNGRGAGLGSGNGNGLGPGTGGNTGGGLRHIGGSVSAPVVLFSPEPEFSEEARRAKVEGNVLVSLQVDANGNPTHVHVIKGIGMGLDEKAMEAVRRYKFRPALEAGRPVEVEMNVEVNFQIF